MINIKQFLAFAVITFSLWTSYAMAVETVREHTKSVGRTRLSDKRQETLADQPSDRRPEKLADQPSDRSVRPTVAASDSLTILITGGFRGRIDGCHCPGGSRGGLGRRVALYGEMFGDRQPVGLDCGGFLDLDPEGGRFASQCTLLGLKRLGLQVMAVGMRDLFYGVDYVRGIADSAGVKLVCANIIDQESGQSLFEPWVSINASGVRIIVTGLAEHLSGRRVPGFNNGATIPPDSVAEKLLNSMPESADLIVLLTDMRESELRRFIPLHPEIKLVLTSSRRVVMPSPFRIDSTLVIRPEPDGGALDGFTLPPACSDINRFVPFSHWLTGSISIDEETEIWMRDCLWRQ